MSSSSSSPPLAQGLGISTRPTALAVTWFPRLPPGRSAFLTPSTRDGVRQHKAHGMKEPPPVLRAGSFHVSSVRRRAGRSRHGLRVLSIAGACRSGRRATPIPSISRGQCAREQTIPPLPPVRIASGWTRRAFPCAALPLSRNRSPPSRHCYRIVFSRVSITSFPLRAPRPPWSPGPGADGRPAWSRRVNVNVNVHGARVA
jgi:hypothetical protein